VRAIIAAALLGASLLGGCDGGGGVVSNPYQCVGLPNATCERMVAEAQQQMPGVAVVGAVIRCTASICTEAQGEASIRVDFANGRYVEYGTGWSQAAPMPALPEPVPVPDQPVPAATPAAAPS
jgi:hypothetical protein